MRLLKRLIAAGAMFILTMLFLVRISEDSSGGMHPAGAEARSYRLARNSLDPREAELKAANTTEAKRNYVLEVCGFLVCLLVEI